MRVLPLARCDSISSKKKKNLKCVTTKFNGPGVDYLSSGDF